jgi:hypothetical protein
VAMRRKKKKKKNTTVMMMMMMMMTTTMTWSRQVLSLMRSVWDIKLIWQDNLSTCIICMASENLKLINQHRTHGSINLRRMFSNCDHYIAAHDKLPNKLNYRRYVLNYVTTDLSAEERLCQRNHTMYYITLHYYSVSEIRVWSEAIPYENMSMRAGVPNSTRRTAISSISSTVGKFYSLRD